MVLQTNLSAILGKKRITQRKFSEMPKLSPVTVHAVYHNKWKGIKRETILKICSSLKVSVADLFEIEED